MNGSAAFLAGFSMASALFLGFSFIDYREIQRVRACQIATDQLVKEVLKNRPIGNPEFEEKGNIAIAACRYQWSNK